MAHPNESDPRQEAADEFDRQAGRGDGAAVVAGLDAGLTVLREALYFRLHRDVEKAIGLDSMLMPVSEQRSERATKNEIEVYQVSVSAVIVQQRKYLATADGWYADWLARWRLGRMAEDEQVAARLAEYAPKSRDEKRLAFSDVLLHTLRESADAPLVLFRLLPEAIEIATALVFRDRTAAEELRARQVACLPLIGDCRECGGRLLENGQHCPECGNPLWNYPWLTASA